MKKTIRHQAVDILNRVAVSRAFAGELLDTQLDEQSLSGTADGRLLTHLVYGVLRMQGHLDWILAGLCRGNYDKIQEAVKNILRSGLYQLEFSDRLPAFAVVDEAVKIAKRINPGTGGLVNAVLRSHLRYADKMIFPDVEKNTAEYIAAFYSHPLWLVEQWLDVFDREETMALCRTNNEAPQPTVRVNTLKMSRSTLEEHLKSQDFNCAPTPFSPDGINLLDPPLPIQKTIFFQKGLLRLQDEAAQLVSCLASPRSGKNILDVCSGSGGKTSHLAALMKNQGRIVALDRDTEKLTQLNKDAARLGISIIETIQADLTCPLPSLLTGQFDVVLVDAPCSGTGTLRRNPEIKWRLKSSDISAHAKAQKTILQNAAAAVQKNGRLVYCTCSLLHSENDHVIFQFLADCPQFTVEPVSTPVLQTFVDRSGFFRTYPHRHTMDGFFGAVFRRRI